STLSMRLLKLSSIIIARWRIRSPLAECCWKNGWCRLSSMRQRCIFICSTIHPESERSASGERGHYRHSACAGAVSFHFPRPKSRRCLFIRHPQALCARPDNALGVRVTVIRSVGVAAARHRLDILSGRPIHPLAGQFVLLGASVIGDGIPTSLSGGGKQIRTVGPSL